MDRGTGEPARQAMRRIDVNPLLMTPTHGTFHHPLVTILTRLYPFPLAPAPVLVVRLIGHVDFTMLLWESGQRGREREQRGQRETPEYCKIQYLGNDACADSCVQNVTGNAIRSDAMRCDVVSMGDAEDSAGCVAPCNYHDFSITQLMSQYFTIRA